MMNDMCGINFRDKLYLLLKYYAPSGLVNLLYINSTGLHPVLTDSVPSGLHSSMNKSPDGAISVSDGCSPSSKTPGFLKSPEGALYIHRHISLDAALLRYENA
jgi:hypothetical protein